MRKICFSLNKGSGRKVCWNMGKQKFELSMFPQTGGSFGYKCPTMRNKNGRAYSQEEIMIFGLRPQDLNDK